MIARLRMGGHNVCVSGVTGVGAVVVAVTVTTQRTMSAVQLPLDKHVMDDSVAVNPGLQEK